MATLFDVLQKFVTEPDKITEVTASSNELYFRFGNNYFSVLERSDSESKGQFGKHSFYVYPQWDGPINDLIHVASVMPPDDKPIFVSYHDTEIDNQSSRLLTRLYKILQEKESRVDEVFRKVLEQ